MEHRFCKLVYFISERFTSFVLLIIWRMEQKIRCERWAGDEVKAEEYIQRLKTIKSVEK